MEQHYLGQIPSWVHDKYAHNRRAAVREFFAAGGFPTAAREDWRFSNLDRLQRTTYRRYPIDTGLEALLPSDLPEWTTGFSHRVLLLLLSVFYVAESQR